MKKKVIGTGIKIHSDIFGSNGGRYGTVAEQNLFYVESKGLILENRDGYLMLPSMSDFVLSFSMAVHEGLKPRTSNPA